MQQSVSPNKWESAAGTTSMNEYRPNLSLVVTAPQETEQHYMTSLTIDLPARGKEFFFSTPRGAAVLSANGISKTITQRLLGLGILLATFALLYRTHTTRRAAL